MRRKRFQNISPSGIVVDGQRYMRGDTFVAAFHPGAEAALVNAGTLRVVEVIDPEPAPAAPLPRATAGPSTPVAPPRPSPPRPLSEQERVAAYVSAPGQMQRGSGAAPPVPAPSTTDGGESARGRSGKKS